MSEATTAIRNALAFIDNHEVGPRVEQHYISDPGKDLEDYMERLRDLNEQWSAVVAHLRGGLEPSEASNQDNLLELMFTATLRGMDVTVGVLRACSATTQDMRQLVVAGPDRAAISTLEVTQAEWADGSGRALMADLIRQVARVAGVDL